MKIVEFQEKDLDTVYAIQRAAYKPLYERYQDNRKYREALGLSD